MGVRSVESLGDSIFDSSAAELAALLKGHHRYPNARAGYIVRTRDYLKAEWNMDMNGIINSHFRDRQKRRDFFASKNIVGIGYKEASHFLRNTGHKGYAILDKHVLAFLRQFGVINEEDIPSNRKRYLEIENKMKNFAERIGIDFDELDIVLWSAKTGEILK